MLELTPDREQARRTLSMFGNVTRDPSTFQTFDETPEKDPKKSKYIHGTFTERAQQLKQF
ncbi:hypothetical protein [Oryzomonas sp.]|uniref:hypothetical protein n=1 Tax=Oryzomonas sp. TaxID=2855186 RepID=UPI0028528C1D|nr:hypothetical protein [Oryzomonas sp.]